MLPPSGQFNYVSIFSPDSLKADVFVWLVLKYGYGGCIFLSHQHPDFFIAVPTLSHLSLSSLSLVPLSLSLSVCLSLCLSLSLSLPVILTPCFSVSLSTDLPGVWVSHRPCSNKTSLLQSGRLCPLMTAALFIHMNFS